MIWLPIVALVVAFVCVIVDVQILRTIRYQRERANAEWSRAATMLAEANKMREVSRQCMRIANERMAKALQKEQQ